MSNKFPGMGSPGRNQRNHTQVLRLLRDAGPLPRTELARRAGLSPTTITKVVAQLLDDGSVAEVEDEPIATGVGRPATDLTLVPDAFAVCGVQVGAGSVRLGVCDLFARVLHSDGFDFDVHEPPAEVVDKIAEHVVTLWRRTNLDPRLLLGIGVAAPGPVDAGQRRNLLSINLGWHDVDFAGPLARAANTATVVDHNVRAMALAEARYGRGAGSQSLAYVYVRTGVGAGLVVHGEPFRGGTHGVSELGHLRVVEKGRRCACGGTGCLETVVSEPYLARQIASAAAAEPDGALAAALDRRTNVLAALELVAADGESQAQALLSELAEHLATGLASVVNLLNPELIVLGGIFAEAPEDTFYRVRQRLRHDAFPVLRDAIQLQRTTLGLDAGVVGGAAVALDRFFYTVDPMPQ